MWQCNECSHDNQNNTLKCVICEAPRPAFSYIGEQISVWVIKKKLGEGGMAMVFLAHHTMLGNPVAIKLLRPEVTHKRDVVERFRTEAEAASRLRHENVIQVIHFGKQEGIGTYMVLEFLEGVDLEAKLLESPMEVPYVLGVAKQICAGLEAAHEAGIIHRDLKPSNIFLVPRANSSIPHVKILDFGIAKIQESHLLEGQQNLTRTGTVLGTPYYLSPEQLRRRKSEDLGPSVDIYAFGVILYQMFTGKLPLEEATLAEQMAAILNHRPPLAGTLVEDLDGTALELYLHRILSKNPQDRPLTIHHSWEELTKAAKVLGFADKDQALRTQWEIDYKPQFTGEIVIQRTGWKGWLLRLAFVFALLVGGGWFGYSFIQPPAPPPLPTPPAAPIPQLPTWQNEGTKAFYSGDYKKAITRWNKVIKSRKFKRGNKHYNPKIYRSMSDAWRKLKHRYASLQALKKYKAEVGTDKLTPAEKQEILRLEQEMRSKKKLLVQSDKAFQTFMEGKNFRDAFDVYQSLKKIQDPSQPAYIRTSLRMAKQLTTRFPQYALAMYNDLEKFKYAINNKKLKQRVVSQRQKLIGKLHTQRQASLDTLRQQMTQKKVRRSRRWRRQMAKSLNRLLRYADDVKAHQELLRLSEEFLQQFPQRVRSLLERYQRVLSSYKRRKDWESWLQPVLTRAKVTPERVQGMLQNLKGIEKAHKLNKTLQGYLRRARFTRAKLLLPKLLARWQETCKKTSALNTYCQQQLKQTQERAKQLGSLIPQWNQIKKLALETNKFKEAKQRFLAFNQKLNKLNWIPPDHKMVRIFSGWERKHRNGNQALRKARIFEKKEDWLKCWSYYKKYIKMYPKAHNVGYARFKRCQCNCKQVVPFEKCDRRCISPKKKRR